MSVYDAAPYKKVTILIETLEGDFIQKTEFVRTSNVVFTLEPGFGYRSYGVGLTFDAHSDGYIFWKHDESTVTLADYKELPSASEPTTT